MYRRVAPQIRTEPDTRPLASPDAWFCPMMRRKYALGIITTDRTFPAAPAPLRSLSPSSVGLCPH